MEDYLSVQFKRFRTQIDEVDRLLESPSSYTSDKQFAETFLRATALKLRLKRFGQLSEAYSRYVMVKPIVLLDRITPLKRKNYAISNSRHLSKLTDLTSRRRVLEKLNQDILLQSLQLSSLEERIASGKYF